MALETLDHPGDYIDGAFRAPRAPDGEIVAVSPADTNDVVGRHAFALAHADEAASAARAAFPAWRRLPRSDREELLRRYQARLREHQDAIAQAIAREVGKPLWDAKGEAGALVAKVDLCIGEGASFTDDKRLEDLPGEIRHRPHGVLAVIGPFNFPVHLPNGQIVPALLLGNTVVFKPSERTPTTATWIARCFEEAGFPRGVFNLVQGDGRTASHLTTHPEVDGVLFTGSVAIGKKIVAANIDRPDRLIALELGGKNASIVLDDCELERTAREIAFAGFASSGQRCTATSRVFVTPGVADALTARLGEIAKLAKVGYPLDAGVFMGPVIAKDARDRLLAAQRDAVAAGFTPIAPGGAIEIAGHPGYYVAPAVHRAPSADSIVASYTETELFAPDLCIHVVRDLDHALERANATPYGLAGAVFTGSRASFEEVADRLRVGVLHWNRSSAGASGRLPFGGVKASGNHRPAGILAGAACSYPLAVLLPTTKPGALPSWPGLLG